MRQRKKNKEERKEKDIPSHQRMLTIPFLFCLKILTYRNLFIQVRITFPAQVKEKQRERRGRGRGGGGEQDRHTQGQGSAKQRRWFAQSD